MQLFFGAFANFVHEASSHSLCIGISISTKYLLVHVFALEDLDFG